MLERAQGRGGGDAPRACACMSRNSPVWPDGSGSKAPCPHLEFPKIGTLI